MLRSLFDFFIFSSIFIACCAVLMVHETVHLLQLPVDSFSLLWFVFFSTLCSYNLHWYFTPFASNERIRSSWTQDNRSLHLILSVSGLIGSAYFAFHFIDQWIWLLPAVVLTFLYTAPKIPIGMLVNLKRIAIGKTIYLAFVWTYVTTVLPVFLSGQPWHSDDILFAVGRFFYVYAICILFDYRDREQDKKEGIRSMITYFDEKGINRLFVFSLLMYAACSLALAKEGHSWIQVTILWIPAVIVASLYSYAKTHYSDYLYYFVLDGLMMFSALCSLFLPI